MVNANWIIIPLLVVAAGWGWCLYWRRHRQMREIHLELHESRETIARREADFSKNRIRWEKTEEKLRTYLKLMDTLINTIANPIYFKDADGIFQGCNKVFSKEILGLTRDRIIGCHPQELTEQIPAELAATYLREERRMFEKAGFHTFEAKVRCADGECRDYLFSLAPVMDEDGSSSGSVAVPADLTDKNRAARDRMRKEKLESVLEIAGAVCHELNQPLQALSGYTELLSMTLGDGENKPLLDKLTSQIERMRDITTKLHHITRYETMEYGEQTKIIDIGRAAGENSAPGSES